MKHDFFYKKIGELSSELLQELQQCALSAEYQSCSDFSANVIHVGRVDQSLLLKLFNELKTSFDANGYIGANFAKMSPMSYIKEHSDLGSNIRDPGIYATMIKLQIPIITNNKVGMMWSPTPNNISVVNFDLGGIYIIDNVSTHSVVNLSSEYRYNLTARFHLASLLDKSLLEV
jgi:hypothetical protein